MFISPAYAQTAGGAAESGGLASLMAAAKQGWPMANLDLSVQRDLLDMQAQAATGLGARAGRSAQDQHLSDALFQLLDALGDGRRRHMQPAGRTLKTAFPHHGGKGFQSSVVEHLENLKMVKLF